MDKRIIGGILIFWGLVGLLGNVVVMAVWRSAPIALVANSAFCLVLLLGGWNLSHQAGGKLAKKEQTKVTGSSSSELGASHLQQEATSAGGTPKQEPQRARCPFCGSNTFRVEEQAGQRRCSDCQTVLPWYIRGNG